MNEDRKRVLIADLDNTLFDWVDLWHACFTAMMSKVIEKKYEIDIPELGLGARISEQSPVVLKSWLARQVADLVVSDDRYRKSKKLHSDAKIQFFYKSIVLLFSLWFFVTLLFIGVSFDQHSLFEFLVHTPKEGNHAR
jgi:hypothetical protein